MNLSAVAADGLVAGAGEEAGGPVGAGRRQQAVDFVGVTLEHGPAVPALGGLKRRV